ncbi:MAG: diguanylate cyclase [Gammaproteobacteria bacterium]|jgi:diguanylate cyclase (GGDEF)-like protein
MTSIRQKNRPQHTGMICAEKPILIIEDQKSLGIMLQDMISERWSCDIHLASTLEEATKLLNENNQYLVALSDLNLPDAQYDKILDTLKAFKIPTVALTGEFGGELREKILSKGVVDYVLKDSINAYSYVVDLLGRLIKNKSIKTLVVDDSKPIRLMLKELLELNGLQVITAENCNDAIKCLKKHHDIKLILTDYNMPDKNGVELTVAVRKKFGKEKLAIIGISEAHGTNTTASFLKNGANDFIHKPLNFEEVITRVNQNLDMLGLLEENYKAANYDFLTQLYNRRAFFRIGQETVEAAFAKGKPITVAMLDIDFFKKVNDTYGHDVGDIVLSQFSQILAKHFHDQLTARLGGEEFAVVMTGIPSSLAEKRLERLRTTVEETVFDEDGTSIHVTSSIGVVNSQDNNDLDELLLIADRQLYTAKESGRNCIIID